MMSSDADAGQDALAPGEPSPAEAAPRSRGRGRGRGRASPRLVLLWVAIAVLVALGLYAAAPWLLPVRIVEGPLVQLLTADELAIVWYTSRPAACTLHIEAEPTWREEPVPSVGARHCARLSDLRAGRAYAYEVRTGNLVLTKQLHLQTARRAGERYSFLVLGDSGKGNRVQYRLAQEMERVSPAPDFVLHTGDLVYPDGARWRYGSNFFAPYRALLSRVPFLPCLGNHDVDELGPDPYLSVFELPDNGPPGPRAGRNYWVDYADARIVVIDSMLPESELAGSVAPWLRTVLSAPQPRWRFVSLHHPPFTGGKYAPDVAIRRTLVPVIDECGVDIVFNGHDHSYQRTYPLRNGQVVEHGTVYIITAAAGASLYQARVPRPDYVARLNNTDYSFTRVVVDGPRLTLSQLALGGRVIDEYVLEKPRAEAAPATSASGAVTP